MTQTQEGYNGWCNRETWNVSLWLNNEEPLYRELVRILEENSDDAKAADAIKEYVEELRDMNGGKFGDLSENRSFEKVDYMEIARDNREE